MGAYNTEDFNNLDITELGALDWRLLLEENNPLNTYPPYGKKMTAKQLQEYLLYLKDLEDTKILNDMGLMTPAQTRMRSFDPAYDSFVSLPVESSVARTSTPFGESKYDPNVIFGDDINHIENSRAEALSTLAKLGNGLGKAVVTAGTTFVNGTLGLVAGGIGSAASLIGDWTGLEDASTMESLAKSFRNEITDGMQDINKEMENILPNYRTEEEQSKSWYQNMGTANFWADFIKQLGFTVGAYYSGGAWVKGLKALGVISKPLGANIVGSLVGAVGEGVVEANLNSRDWYEYLIALLNDLAMAQKNLLDKQLYEGTITKPIYDAKINELSRNRSIALDNLLEKSYTAGMIDLGTNIPLLMLDNMFMFGKLYSKGFNTAKKAAGNTRKTIRKEALQSVNEALGSSSPEVIENTLKRNGRYVWDEITKGSTYAKGFGNFFREGNEELALAFFSEFSGNMVSPDSPDAYYKALTDPKALDETKSFLTSLTEGLANSYGSLERWLEFIMGGLTGLLGTPTFGRSLNSSENTWFGRNRMIGISGGLVGLIKSDRMMNKLGQENVDFINDYLDKYELDRADGIRHFAASNAFVDAMNGWAEEGNAFEYKNALDNEDFMAMSRFHFAGRTLDILDIIDLDFENISDEELDKIAKYNTSDENNQWKNADGSYKSETPEGREEMRKALIEKRDTIKQEIKDFLDSVDSVLNLTENQLDKDKETELAWLSWKIKRFNNRFKNIKEENKELFQTLRNNIQQYLEATDDSEEGNKYKKNFLALIDFIDYLNQSSSSLELATRIYANLENLKTLNNKDSFDLYMSDAEGNPSGMSLDDYIKAMTNLRDAGRLASISKTFNERLYEYLNDTSAQLKRRDKTNLEQSKKRQDRDKQQAEEAVKNKTPKDILGEYNDGNISDDFLKQASEFDDSAKKANEVVDIQQSILDYTDENDFSDSDKQIINNVLLKQIDNWDDSTDSDGILNTDTIPFLDDSTVNFLTEEEQLLFDEANQETKEILKQRAEERKEKTLKTFYAILNSRKNGTTVPLAYVPETTNKDLEEETKNTTGNDKTPTVESSNSKSLQKWLEEVTSIINNDNLDFGSFNDHITDNEREGYKKLLANCLAYTYNSLKKGQKSFKDLLNNIKTLSFYNTLVENDVIDGLLDLLEWYFNKTKEELYGKTKEETIELYGDSNIDEQENQLEPFEQTEKNINNFQSEALLDNTHSWRPLMSYLPLFRFYNNNKGFIDSLPEGRNTPFYKIIEAMDKEGKSPYSKEYTYYLIELGKYLELKRAYTNRRNLTVGQKINFVTDTEFNNRVKATVWFMTDEKDNIVGSLPILGIYDDSSEERRYIEGIQEANDNQIDFLLFAQKQLEKAYQLANSTNIKLRKDNGVLVESEVTEILIGKPLYQAQRLPLNDVFKGNKLKLAINKSQDINNPSFVLSGVFNPKEFSKILQPVKAPTGKAEVIVYTSSERKPYLPIPFSTPKFTKEILNSTLHRYVVNLLENYNKNKNLKTLKEGLNLIFGKQNFGYDDSSSSDSIYIHIGSNTISGKRVATTSEPFYYFNKKEGINIDDFLNRLYSLNMLINIALSKINDTRPFFENKTYNYIIGEIASVNLPANGGYTVDDWFKIKEINSDGNTTKEKTRTTKNLNENPNLAYTVVSFDLKKFEVDKNTFEIKDKPNNISASTEDMIRCMAYCQLEGYTTNSTFKMPFKSKTDNQSELRYNPVTKQISFSSLADNDLLLVPEVDDLEEIPQEDGYDNPSETLNLNLINTTRTVNVTPLIKTQKTPIITEESLWNSKEARVEASKLLHKDEVDDVLYVAGEFSTIEVTYKIADNPNILGEITFDHEKNRWDINIVYADEDDDSIPLEELDKAIDEHTLSREKMQEKIDYFLPKDLQEFFTSGKFAESMKEANKFFDALRKENPNSTIDDRVKIFNNTNRGKGIGINILRDNWGIYTFNESTKESNFIEEQLQSTLKTILSEEEADQWYEDNFIEEEGISFDLWQYLPLELRSNLINAYNTSSDKTLVNDAILDIARNNDNLEGISDRTKALLNGEEKYRKVTLYSKPTRQILHEEMEWLRRTYPLLSGQERLRIINGLILVANSSDKEYAWGKFKDGIMYISNKAALGTVYHEAFHAVVSLLMDLREIDNMFEAAMKKYGNKSRLELEENLAEDFRRYMQMNESQEGNVITRFFRLLKNIITSLFSNGIALNNVFGRISNGVYANKNKNDLAEKQKTESSLILDYHINKISYKTLNQELKDYLLLHLITPEIYEQLSLEEKERLLYCMS